jgi:hypothetical protein
MFLDKHALPEKMRFQRKSDLFLSGEHVLHLQEWERIYGMGEVESAIGGPASAFTRAKVCRVLWIDWIRFMVATTCTHRLSTMAAP